MHILKHSNLGSFKNSSDTSRDEEFQMLKKIDQGSVTDTDINKVVSQGGRALRFMEQKARAERRKLDHYNKKYGKGVFDGVDNDGNPYKDHQVGSVKNTEYSPTQAEHAKTNLEPLK